MDDGDPAETAVLEEKTVSRRQIKGPLADAFEYAAPSGVGNSSTRSLYQTYRDMLESSSIRQLDRALQKLHSGSISGRICGNIGAGQTDVKMFPQLWRDC